MCLVIPWYPLPFAFPLALNPKKVGRYEVLSLDPVQCMEDLQELETIYLGFL